MNRIFACVALGGGVLFAAVVVLVEANSFLVRLDESLAERCFAFTLDRPRVREFFLSVTDLGWGKLLNGVGAILVVLILVRREWFKAIVWALGMYATHWIVPWLKNQFLRARPPFADIDGLSFPSGHAFGSAVVYGLVGVLVLTVWQGSRWRLWFAWVVWSLIPLVALSRMMLGVHYFSDVLAGAAGGLAWAGVVAVAGSAWPRRGSPL